MAGKKQDKWVIDEWDDSLDIKTKEKQDPFSPVPAASENEDWGLSPDTQKKESEKKLPGWAVPAACGVCALILIIVGISLFSRKEDPVPEILQQVVSKLGTDPVQSGTAAGPTVYLTSSPAPATPTPVLITSSPTASPTPAPTIAPSVLDRNEWYGKDLRYYYLQLTDHEKLVFEQIYDGLVRFQSEISFSPCTKTEFDHVLDVIHFDSPELFHASGAGVHWDGPLGINRFDPDYRMDQATYDRICDHIHGIIDQLKRQFPAGADDYGKELLINDYLVDHCEYLIAGDDSTAYADACLYYGKSQCSGYARAFSLLLRSSGIKSMDVHSEDHEWNIVRINGNWYHADSTWNDNEAEGKPGGNRYYSWLNVPDRLAKDPDHLITSISGFTVPECISLQDNYACREGVFCPAGTTDPASLLFSGLENKHRSGLNSVIVLFEDPATVAAWDDVWNRFYNVYKGYDWLLYQPGKENCQCTFAVWNSK